MKHKTPAEETPRNEEAAGGPGAQLRRARERKGIELSKVASQLHLSQAKIEALEGDDYAKLSSPVFVQGYLRNYARLLGVDEDAVVHTYQELNPGLEHSTPLPRNQPDEVVKELHNDPRLFRLITWVVVIVLAVLLFVWLQDRLSMPEVEPLAPSDQGETEAPPLFSPEPMVEAPEPPAPLVSEPGVEGLPAEEVPAPVPEAVGAGEATGIEPMLEREIEVSPPDRPEDLSGGPGAAVEVAPAPSAESPPLVPGLREGGAEISRGLVEFEFRGPCWIEVRDANGRLRIFGEMRAGVQRRLDGVLGPFQVVIGDIGVVSLTVNGKAFDIKPFARGKVARFTLDASRL